MSRTRRGTARVVDDENEIEEAEQDNNSDNDENSHDVTPQPITFVNADIERMANELVRMALFSENSRTSIRRTNIYKVILSDTITGIAKTRTYRSVFNTAQSKLRAIFGMEFVALPAREYPQDDNIHNRTTTTKANNNNSKRQKTGRNARKVTNGNNEPRANPDDNGGSAEDIDGETYILRSVLPENYRQVVATTRSDFEKSYLGYAFIVCSIIALREQSYIEKADLCAYLYPMGLDAGKAEALLSRMIRNNYLLSKKYRLQKGDKQLDFYSLGPRAKVEFKAYEGFQSICAAVLGNRYTDIVAGQIDDRLKKVKMFDKQEEETGQGVNEVNREEDDDDISDDES